MLFIPSIAFGRDCNLLGYNPVGEFVPRLMEGFSELMMKATEPSKHPYVDACVLVDMEKGLIVTAKSNDEETAGLNIYMRHLPKETAGGADLNTFFQSAKEKIKARIARERQKIQEVKKCLNTKSGNDCIKIDSQTKEMLGVGDNYKFNNLIVDARSHLLLSYPEGFLSGIRDDVSILNWPQRSYGVFKKKRWSSFTPEERVRGQETLDYYYKAASEDAATQPNPRNYKNSHLATQTVKEARQAHLLFYTDIMARYPILQFVKNLNPEKKEVASAADQMLASIDEEEKWLDEVTSSIGTGTLHKDLLRILNYRDEIQETLLEKNEYCGVARDLKHLADAKGLGFDVGIFAPVMVASVFVPISYTAVMGLAAGGVLSFNEQKHVQEASYRVLGRFDPKSSEDLHSLGERIQNRNIEVIATALGASGLRSVGKAIRIKRSTHSLDPRASQKPSN